MKNKISDILNFVRFGFTMILNDRRTIETLITIIIAFYQISVMILLGCLKKEPIYFFVFGIISINHHIITKAFKIIYNNKFKQVLLLNPRKVCPDCHIDIEKINFHLLLSIYSICLIDILFYVNVFLKLSLESLIILVGCMIIIDLFIILILFVYSKKTQKVTGDYNQNHRSDLIIFFSGLKNTAYQLDQWIDVLEKLELKKTIILRGKDLLNFGTQLKIPCMLINGRINNLFGFFSGNEKAVFYVNNSIENFNILAIKNLAHILLLHGESDKGPSTSNVSRVYDFLFVAGEAAVKRYENEGIHIMPEKFRIVGRPQLENILKRSSQISNHKIKTILYAPTFEGFKTQDNYSSLEKFGLGMAKAILDSEQYRLIVKLHPLTLTRSSLYYKIAMALKDLIKSHRSGLGNWVNPVKNDKMIYDCFAESDLLIGDISSVSIDYLILNRPIIATNPFGIDISKGKERFPFWKGSYVINNSDDILDLVRIALEKDPKKTEREQIARYYLGENIFDDKNLTAQFVDTVNRIINNSTVHSLSASSCQRQLISRQFSVL
jgi:hypothetical protein